MSPLWQDKLTSWNYKIFITVKKKKELRAEDHIKFDVPAMITTSTDPKYVETSITLSYIRTNVSNQVSLHMEQNNLSSVQHTTDTSVNSDVQNVNSY
jgi:DNA-directed RNA polymerase subunit E'/Rpb7